MRCQGRDWPDGDDDEREFEEEPVVPESDEPDDYPDDEPPEDVEDDFEDWDEEPEEA
jgi:hypothetical protein